MTIPPPSSPSLFPVCGLNCRTSPLHSSPEYIIRTNEIHITPFQHVSRSQQNILSPSFVLLPCHRPPSSSQSGVGGLGALQSSKPCTLGRNLMTSSPSRPRCRTGHFLTPANSPSVSNIGQNSQHRRLCTRKYWMPFQGNATYSLVKEHVTVIGIEEEHNCTGVRPVEGVQVLGRTG